MKNVWKQCHSRWEHNLWNVCVCTLSCIKVMICCNFSSRQRRTQNRRLNSHKKHKRRRKVAVAAKPRRRSGPKEKSGISWTIRFSSIRPPMKNCTRKYPSTNWSLPLWSLNVWRSVALWPSVLWLNCAKRVSVKFVYLVFLRF